MFNLLPKDAVFFDLFEKLAQHALTAANYLAEMAAKYPDAADLQVMRVVAEIDEILARKSENGESFEEWFWTNEGFLRHPVWGEIRELSRAFLVR